MFFYQFNFHKFRLDLHRSSVLAWYQFFWSVCTIANRGGDSKGISWPSWMCWREFIIAVCSWSRSMWTCHLKVKKSQKHPIAPIRTTEFHSSKNNHFFLKIKLFFFLQNFIAEKPIIKHFTSTYCIGAWKCHPWYDWKNPFGKKWINARIKRQEVIEFTRNKRAAKVFCIRNVITSTLAAQPRYTDT